MKWLNRHGGYHSLEHEGATIASVGEMRTSLKATIFHPVTGQIYNSKYFSCGGLLAYLSSSISRYKRNKAIKKAKQWVEENI